jgi:hypothetical protein
MAGEGFNDPNTTHEVHSSRVKIPATEYIGQQGRIFYHEDTGELRISDGVTPHGRPIFVHTGSGGTISLNLYASSGDPAFPPIATGTNSTALGEGASSYAAGAVNQASGMFTGYGDAQTGSYIARNITTDNVLTELFLDGASARIQVPPNATVSFKIEITARRTDSGQEGAIYELRGGADRGAFTGSLALLGRVNKTVVTEDNPAWDATVTVDTATSTLQIWVKGEVSKTVRWVAHIKTVEVRN